MLMLFRKVSLSLVAQGWLYWFKKRFVINLQLRNKSRLLISSGEKKGLLMGLITLSFTKAILKGLQESNIMGNVLFGLSYSQYFRKRTLV